MVRTGRHRWWVRAGIVALVAAVAFWLTRAQEPGLPALFPAPAFQLVDQDGAPFASGELEGKVWVAGFIYTTCPDICPIITVRLAALADSLAADELLGSDVHLVTFTVDPERDTPAVLTAYAERQGVAGRAGWSFVTGAPDNVHPLIREGFFIGASRSLGRSAADTVELGAGADHAGHGEPGTGPAPEAAGGADHGEHGVPAQGSVVPDSVPAGVRRGLEAELRARDTAAASAGMGSAAGPGLDPTSPERATTSPGGEPYLVTHSDYLLLIDRGGTVRGVYSGTSGAELRQLLGDLRDLARGR